MTTTSPRHRIAQSITWLVWSRVAVQFTSLFSTLLVARLLDPSDYGLIGLCGIWIAAFTHFSELGLGAAVLQFRNADDGDLNACFWLNTAISVAGFGILFIASPWVAQWLSTPSLAPVLRVVALSLPLGALRTVPENLLRRDLALDKVSQALLISNIVAIPFVLGLAIAGAGVWALVSGIVLVPAVHSAATFIFARWRPGFVVRGQQLGAMLRYGMASVGATISWSVYHNMDSLLLGKFAGASAVGIYTVAKHLATLPVDKLVTLVSQLLSPMLAARQDDRALMRASALRAIRFVSWLTIPIFGGLMVMADDVIRVALTAKWVAAAPVLAIMCAISLLRVLESLLIPALMATYRPRFVLRYQSTLMVALIPAFAVGAYWYGAAGVALAWLAVYPVPTLWMAQKALRELDGSLRLLWKEVQTPFVVTASMMLAQLAFGHLLDSVAIGPGLMHLLLLASAGAAVYLIGLLTMGASVRTEMLQIAIWLVRGSRHTSAAAARP